MRRTLALSIGLLLAWPCLGAAQGLGDVAARERQRRQAASGKTPSARVLTDADLNEGRPPGQKEAPATAAPSEGQLTVEAPPSTVVDSDAQLRPFVDAVNKAKAGVEQQEARIRELGAKLNPMNTSFIYGATGSNSANEEAQVRAAMGQAEAELAQARQGLNAANQALSDASRGGSSAAPTPR